jgi:hypothetical protein
MLQSHCQYADGLVGIILTTLRGLNSEIILKARQEDYLAAPLRMSTRSYNRLSSSQIVGSGLRDIYPQRTLSIFFPQEIARQDPPTLCSKQQEVRGLHPVGALFPKKSAHHSKISRSATRFYSRKHSDDARFCTAKPEGTRRGFQSSTMKCSGACRYIEP